MNNLQTMKAKSLNLNCYLMAAQTRADWNVLKIGTVKPLLSLYLMESSKKPSGKTRHIT